MENPYHCCATCIHIRGTKSEKKTTYFCSRLGYETNTTYQFSCWEPKEEVLELMRKRGIKS
ncbi:hypothetical protein FGG79_01320 [Bacillus sp. BHET2]|uniref:hypothetical protein n=1 Tax=Bacillus sp. BHET2 TaxID=2583818 RepID=UPI00110DE37F|nr:hypothetical protein [Bacillus sp. BHET2]TMU86816.1 hypothetical protein FGG79_01320 [Bacillus sp. BHET2]